MFSLWWVVGWPVETAHALADPETDVQTCSFQRRVPNEMFQLAWPQFLRVPQPPKNSATAQGQSLGKSN